MSTELQDLIRKAIGVNRTQSDFAREAGLTPQYLNRLLNSDDIGKPTRSTLMKLSGCSGIPLAKFLKACGYDDADEEMKKELRSIPVKDRIKTCVSSILEGFSKMSENHPVYSSLYEFIDTVFTIYEDEQLSVSIGEPIEVGKGGFGIAECVAVATISWSDDYNISPKVCGFSAEMDVLICYAETLGGSVIISEVCTDQSTLYNFESEVVRQLMEINDFREESPAVIIHKKMKPSAIPDGVSAEERLLLTIFGNTSSKETIIQEEGYGFYLDNTPMYVIKKFIEAHKDVLSETVWKNYEDSISDMPEDFRENQDGYPCYAIAEIMRKETGLSFSYEYDTEIDGEHQTLLFPIRSPWEYSDQEKELTKSGLIKLLDVYARELRTEVQYCTYRYIGDDQIKQ